MARIVVERGNEKGVSFTFDDATKTAVVGRLKTCHLVLTDCLVSRQHFAVARVGEKFAVADLHSHNGTFLNGQQVTKALLPFGATIRAGETLLQFVADDLSDKGALAGRNIGGYHLLERIGVGGMGEVYKAMQMSLGRTVALKILSPELTRNRAFVERFLREARAAGKLNHPNVVQVHDASEEQGLYFFSMEYVDGGSVQELISGNRKLEPERATEIILQAAGALEFARKAGIVHCDIKPDNLMLTAAGEVRLADLGIAKHLNEKGTADQSDGVFGSPHFMSPEQAQGLSLDHRSDLYSLGVTYYRVLLGRVPFSGKDAKEIMERQVFDEPEPARAINNDLPPLVYNILDRLLRKKPADRYQTAAQLVTDLELALKHIRQGVRGSTGIALRPARRVRYRGPRPWSVLL